MNEEPRDADAQEPSRQGAGDAPWWHSAPTDPPVDSVLVEGLKLANALRDWAVESGAVAAAAGLAQSAANSASAYLTQGGSAAAGDQDAGPEPPQPVVRCADCPVCQGLDALDRTNPQLAQTARAALSQVNALLSGFLGAAGSQSGRANP